MKTKTIPAGVEHKALPFEIKAVGGEGYGTFEGIGGAFNNLDSGGDIIAPGAFTKGLAKFLADGFIGGEGHNWDDSIGHPASAEERPEGLWIRGVYDNTPAAQSTRAKMTPNPITGRATIKELSIGYVAKNARRLADVVECKSYWQSVDYLPTERDLARAEKGARLLLDIDLIEVSPVGIPMNDMAKVHSVKSSGSEGFDEQSEKAAQTVSEYAERCHSRHEARFKEGRVLSASNRTSMIDALETIEAAAEKIRAVIESSEPKQKGDAAKAAEVVLPEVEIEPTPVVVPAIDEAEIHAQFALTMYATNPVLN